MQTAIANAGGSKRGLSLIRFDDRPNYDPGSELIRRQTSGAESGSSLGCTPSEDGAAAPPIGSSFACVSEFDQGMIRKKPATEELFFASSLQEI